MHNPAILTQKGHFFVHTEHKNPTFVTKSLLPFKQILIEGVKGVKGISSSRT